MEFTRVVDILASSKMTLYSFLESVLQIEDFIMARMIMLQEFDDVRHAVPVQGLGRVGGVPHCDYSVGYVLKDDFIRLFLKRF